MAVLKKWLIEALTPLAKNRPSVRKDITNIEERTIPDDPQALLVVLGFILRNIFKCPDIMDDPHSSELKILTHFCDDHIIATPKPENTLRPSAGGSSREDEE